MEGPWLTSVPARVAYRVSGAACVHQAVLPRVSLDPLARRHTTRGLNDDAKALPEPR